MTTSLTWHFTLYTAQPRLHLTQIFGAKIALFQNMAACKSFRHNNRLQLLKGDRIWQWN